ncbi:hypothetical protein PG997_008057 [Apiospora hydei]|uniref:Transcription factor IIIC 90kDa subunit N-terminal domain-containing protein n=1 Tax=Apiospora hydei TaxID=1337664 RepID=A0ABR1WDI9_9PEZI
MSAPDRGHILPLESFGVSAVPLTTHNIAWSPDAELAITSDDCVYLYFPEFPSGGTTAAGAFGSDFETQRQYYEVSFRFPVVEIRRPELNRHLFTASGQEFPDFPPTFGAGVSLVANIGTSLNHAVAVEWSPSGLGLMRRSVLAVLTGTGALTIFCEGVSDGLGTIKMKGRNVRTVSSWVVPWSVGDNLLGHESDYSKERITSFAWAKEGDDPGCLLAYVNDEDEVVILAVQSRHDPAAPSGSAGEWKVEEVVRFVADGPHPKGDPSHPDFSPHGSSFALRWGPWYKKNGNYKTCILAYITRNYVGFREVIMRSTWRPMETPKVDVQSSDSNGICIHLAPDAFLQWEDMIWTVEGARVCRGIIATPARVQPFQVTFDSSASPDVTTPHSTEVCGTTYASDEEAEQALNPITGMVIHPPNLSESGPSPYFSLVRLSATASNHDWYQTNLPIASDPNSPSTRPKWATEMTQFIEEKQPMALAYRPVNPEGKLPKGDNDEDAAGDEEEEEDDDDDDDEDEEEDDDGSDWGSVEDFSKTEYLGELERLAGMEKVNMTRIRTWGMTASPGGGTHAVFVTLNSTIKPERHTFGGMRCRVLFGQNIAPPDERVLAMKKLSTEGSMWEWMYGGGPPVPGASDLASVNHSARNATRERLMEVAHGQSCNCAATGVPIIAPGSTHTCSVCGLKCLKPQQVKVMTQNSELHDYIERDVSAELCGGCGGKFMN